MENELNDKFDEWLHKDEATYVRNKIAKEELFERNKRIKRIHEINIKGLESFIDTKMIFGKYRDRYVLDILDFDFDYLLWIINKIEKEEFKASPKYVETDCVKFIHFLCETKCKSYILDRIKSRVESHNEWERERANRENDLWNEKNPNKNRKSWVDYNNPANYDENMWDTSLF